MVERKDKKNTCYRQFISPSRTSPAQVLAHTCNDSRRRQFVELGQACLLQRGQLGGKKTLVSKPGLSHSGLVTFIKSFNLSGPQFPNLSHGRRGTYFPGCFSGTLPRTAWTPIT